jgi:hypothetical protein
MIGADEARVPAARRKGDVSAAGRGAFFKAKAHWINTGGIMAEDKGLIWRK